MNIFLCDYVSRANQWVINTESNTANVHTISGKSNARETSVGFGAFIRVGLLRRSAKFFGLYANDGSVYLYADNQVFGADGRLEFTTSSVIFPVARRATLRLDGEVRCWKYWHNELLDDGMHTRDFLEYVAEVFGSLEKTNSFLEYWRARVTL